jgi:2-keto-3-deoxy-L-rhamnonate aldolase RhmA
MTENKAQDASQWHIHPQQIEMIRQHLNTVFQPTTVPVVGTAESIKDIADALRYMRYPDVSPIFKTPGKVC